MHKKVSVHHICFIDKPFAEIAACWRELDAHLVTIMGSELRAQGVDAARAALATGDYKVETIVDALRFGPLDTGTGWDAERASLNQTIDTAAALGAKSVYMVTGGRGSLSWDEAAARFCEGIRPCVARAKEKGVHLLIENSMTVYADIHLAHSLTELVDLAEMADLEVCIDLYPCWTEAKLRETIKRALPRCQLVQVADYIYGDRSVPGRAVPGDGVIPLTTILGWIIEGGYRGNFDLELVGPRIDAMGPVEAVRRGDQHVGAILRSLGVA
jgi:sugar phosphate isomerase/epimerase